MDRHQLYNLDLDQRKADCVICGPLVTVRPHGQGRWRCEAVPRTPKTREARERQRRRTGSPPLGTRTEPLKRWQAWEDDLVLHTRVSNVELASLLGRSAQAIGVRRHTLLHDAADA